MLKGYYDANELFPHSDSVEMFFGHAGADARVVFSEKNAEKKSIMYRRQNLARLKKLSRKKSNKREIKSWLYR